MNAAEVIIALERLRAKYGDDTKVTYMDECWLVDVTSITVMVDTTTGIKSILLEQ